MVSSFFKWEIGAQYPGSYGDARCGAEPFTGDVGPSIRRGLSKGVSSASSGFWWGIRVTTSVTEHKVTTRGYPCRAGPDLQFSLAPSRSPNGQPNLGHHCLPLQGESCMQKGLEKELPVIPTVTCYASLI